MQPIELPFLPSDPLVSVLISSYNYEKYVGRAIDSVLSQTYRNVEVVVCDDGSRDNSCKVIERYAKADSRVTLIRQENGGHSSAYNCAFRHARGSILCILDSDDYYERRKLELVTRRFQELPDVGYLIHPLMLVDGGGCALQPLTLIDNFEEGWIADRILRRGGRWRSMAASGVCFRREVARYVYPLPDGIYPDVLFNTLLPLVTKVAVVREYLGFYTLHGNNWTSEIRNFTSTGKSIASAAQFLTVVERAMGAVNRRIEELGLDIPRLDLARNLDYQVRSLALDLLAGKPLPQLVRRYLSLVPEFCRDDLYGPRHKVVLLTAYGIALGLPQSMRRRLIAMLHLPNKLRYRFLRMGKAKGMRSGENAQEIEGAGSR
jgi:glycosyltransferase involved in cell wall biosynthesis